MGLGYGAAGERYPLLAEEEEGLVQKLSEKGQGWHVEQ